MRAASEGLPKGPEENSSGQRVSGYTCLKECQKFLRLFANMMTTNAWKYQHNQF